MKDRIMRTYMLEPETVKRLNVYAAMHGIYISEIVNTAIEMYLDEADLKK
jgi:diacylglycerol kinase